jgi:transcriptional regulator with XRE-family HTH domain
MSCITVCKMAARANPTVLRRQLGAELRRLRDGARRTVADAAGQLGWSESKLSRIETAHSGIRRADLDLLLGIYDVSEVERERLYALAGQARQRAWWEAYGDSLASSYETFIGFEAEATGIYSYETLVIPGLLQTAEYARAVTQIEHAEDPDLVGQRVAVRMARQAILTREPPPKFWAILDEATLRRPIGGPDVMRRQLLRLVEASEMSMVTIQVLPFDVGAHRGLTGSFVVLEFVGASEHPLVYCEGMTGGVIRSKPEELREYWMSFESLRSKALSPKDSVDFITAVARGERQ